jgi:hypothetical protein
MLTSNLTTDQLDRFLQISSFCDSKMAKVKAKSLPTMYKVIENAIGIGHDKESLKNFDATTARLRITLTSRQLTIYDFVMLVMLDAKPETRELIYLRNFPNRKSLRQMKRMYLDWSHEKIRYKYHRALVEVCLYANKNLKKYLTSGQKN